MNRRRLLWSAVAVVFGSLLLLAALEVGPGPSAMKAKADAIHLGMTESEVDAILGRPARDQGAVDRSRHGRRGQAGLAGSVVLPQGQHRRGLRRRGKVEATPMFVAPQRQ